MCLLGNQVSYWTQSSFSQWLLPTKSLPISIHLCLAVCCLECQYFQWRSWSSLLLSSANTTMITLWKRQQRVQWSKYPHGIVWAVSIHLYRGSWHKGKQRCILCKELMGILPKPNLYIFLFHTDFFFPCVENFSKTCTCFKRRGAMTKTYPDFANWMVYPFIVANLLQCDGVKLALI